MKKYNSIHFLILFFVCAFISTNLISQSEFKTYENDPLNLKETILENGMKVYLVENHDKPEISGAIVVNVGSKNDPADNTGMAHYLEHMLFKGTKTLGTSDYEKEKVHLDAIVSLYDELGKETDDEKRNEIQKKINEASNLAAEYALPNEFDRIIAEMGGTQLNAFTSADMTVYLNVFPPNQIEKWLDVYVHRFQDPVFRLFQSELETVYEEKNRSMNESMSFMFEYFLSNIFKGHPYGDQTTLGKTEHLKNPSLSTMYSYFYKYYVPNNMALVLVGDFDSETILPIIKTKMNQMPFKALEKDDNFPIDPIKGRQTLNIKSSPIKMAAYGFRMKGLKSANKALNDVMLELLTNETETGLIDELQTNGEILGGLAMNVPYNDHGALVILNIPKLIGQSFEEAEALLFNKLDTLKKGGFSDETLEAIKKGLLKQKKLSLETNEDIAYELYQHFVSGNDWSKTISYSEELDQITRNDIVEYAKSIFGDDFISLYSSMGSTPKEKMVKPEREPVVSKSKEKSEYYHSFLKIKEQALSPDYVNFDKDLTRSELDSKVVFIQNENPKNDVFELTYRWDIGSFNDSRAIYLAEYLNSVGSTSKAFDDYRKAIQKLNASYYFDADQRYFYLVIDGEDNQALSIIDLLDELIQSAAIDESKIKELVEMAKSNIKFEKASPSSVAGALREYAIYKTNSTKLQELTVKEIGAITPKDYLAFFDEVKAHPMTIHYTGNNIKVKSKLNDIFKTKATKKVASTILDRKEEVYSENTIYFINQKKSTQANIHFNFSIGKIPVDEYYKLNAFNEYFGKGMSSLVFQEIREFRSLAYSSYGFCRTGRTPNNNSLFYGFVGCQNDKTIEAIEIMMGLITNMPEKTERIDYIKGATIRSSLTSVPGFRNLIEQVGRWKELGFSKDPRELLLPNYENLTFGDIMTFYNKYIKGKPIVISIVGDKKQIDMKQLEKFGKVIKLKKKDIYVE